MAIEDAAVIGTLLSKVESRSLIPEVLRLYESLRKPRATFMVNRSRGMFKKGEQKPPAAEQKETDKIEGAGVKQHATDPKFQSDMYGYDAIEEANKVWHKYLSEKNNARQQQPVIQADQKPIDGAYQTLYPEMDDVLNLKRQMEASIREVKA